MTWRFLGAPPPTPHRVSAKPQTLWNALIKIGISELHIDQLPEDYNWAWSHSFVQGHEKKGLYFIQLDIF